MHGKKIKKTLLTFISILYSIAVSLQPVIAVGSIDQKESLKSSLQKETEALKANLQKAKEGMKEEAEKKNTLDKQIEIVKSQVDNSNRYITSLEQEIKRHEQGISSILEDIKKKMKALKSSLKSIYMAGDASTIDIILSAKDFDDFLDKAELVKSVSDTISSLIKQLNSSLKELENEKSALQETVDTAQKERDIQSKRRSELQKLFDESEKMLSELQKSEQQVKKELDENDAELKQIEKQIREYYEEQRRKKAAEEARRKARQSFGAKLDKQTAAVSEIVHKGSYTWPVPGYFHISSDFYDTVNRGGKTHGAIDIAGSGIYGAKVVAAGKGQVIIASSGGWGGGYGTYMVIDHGDSRLTLYGHLSGLAVEAGDTVLQGQLIGYVGSTGISTGPHLHFECRVNGVKVNPMPWFNR